LSRAILALLLLVAITAALQIGGALRAGEAASVDCSLCHD